jgi:hypothetical protein
VHVGQWEEMKMREWRQQGRNVYRGRLFCKFMDHNFNNCFLLFQKKKFMDDKYQLID